jgi:hypothetical protein
VGEDWANPAQLCGSLREKIADAFTFRLDLSSVLNLAKRIQYNNHGNCLERIRAHITEVARHALL